MLDIADEVGITFESKAGKFGVVRGRGGIPARKSVVFLHVFWEMARWCGSNSRRVWWEEYGRRG